MKEEAMNGASRAQATPLSTPPTFRQKRSHTKSRFGCITCKQRRVKCDESVPGCRVCLGRGIRCEYAGPKKRHAQVASSIPTTLPPRSCTATQPTKYVAHDAAQHIILDAFLWKYYLAHASKTIIATSTDPGHTRMWQESIPAIAFSDPMASHAMMAFSAFCLSASKRMTSQTHDIRAIAEKHYQRSLLLLRNSLPTVDLTSADAVLACGMILVPCGLALAQSDPGVFSLNDWLVHLRGWRNVGSSLYGSKGRVKSVVKLIPYPQQGIPDPDDLPKRPCDRSRTWSPANALMDKIHDSCHRAIADLKRAINDSSTNCNAADTEACLAAVTALEYILDYTLEYPVANLFRAVFIWAILIPPRYIELLTSHDKLAQAIYAHWLVLTVAIDDLWWVHGFGSGEIERLASQPKFSKLPGSKLLRWPMEMARYG